MASTLEKNCRTCALRACFVARLSPEALKDFIRFEEPITCPPGTILFREGEHPTAIFVLCSGQVRLSVGAQTLDEVTLRVVNPGEVIGLGAAVSGNNHDVTAKTSANCELLAIQRRHLFPWIRNHIDAGLAIVHYLSDEVQSAYQRVRDVGLNRPHRHAPGPYEMHDA
jgi:CRP/FNR family transcriptional regulator